MSTLGLQQADAPPNLMSPEEAGTNDVFVFPSAAIPSTLNGDKRSLLIVLLHN